jgi:FkbM family methyltransferase
MVSEADSKELLRMQAEDIQVFENIITRIYAGVLQRGDTCLDGGAHAGLHTFPMARIVGPEGTVVAVEPVPAIAHSLEKALTAQDLQNVRVIQKALYHETRTMPFNVIKDVPTRSSIELTQSWPESDVETIQISTVLIDDLLRDVESWRFCKLDLEGSEFRALQGGQSSIDRYSPFLVFEKSSAASIWYQYTPSEFVGFFRDLGYETFDLFGTRLGVSDWTAPGRPWYALGVRSGSEDAAFVRDRLPTILQDLLEAERSPVTESYVRPTGPHRPFIWAVPNPVPAGSGTGTTVIHCDTGDGSIGEVYLSVNWDQERPFFRGSRGSRAAPWIHAWSTYEFKLYRGLERRDLLGAVTVTRRKR